MDPQRRLAQGIREFGEYGGVNPSIELSTTFTVLEASTLPAIFNGRVGPEGGCYVYGRAFNPTVRHLGRLFAKLEGTEAAYPCSSGMAAVACSILSLCNAGDHIVASDTIYGGTFALLQSYLPQKCGIQTTFVDVRDLTQVAAAVQGNTKVIYTEVLSNPTLRVADVEGLARIAAAVNRARRIGGDPVTAAAAAAAVSPMEALHLPFPGSATNGDFHPVRKGGAIGTSATTHGRMSGEGGDGSGGAALAGAREIKIVVDNTFSPVIVNPAALGADVVVHSLTKFASGNSDVIAGVICASAAFINDLMNFHTGSALLLGPTMDPRVASELGMRVQHLPLRMQEHGRRALFFARRLEMLGAKVLYPGLPSHPQHHLLRRLIASSIGDEDEEAGTEDETDIGEDDGLFFLGAAGEELEGEEGTEVAVTPGSRAAGLDETNSYNGGTLLSRFSACEDTVHGVARVGKRKSPGLAIPRSRRRRDRTARFGFGGVMGVDLGSAVAAEMFMERLQNHHAFGLLAVSLGYFDTLMSLSASSTSSEMDSESLGRSGITGGYVRMSIGITGSLAMRWRQLKESYLFVRDKFKSAAVAERLERTLSPTVATMGHIAVEAEESARPSLSPARLRAALPSPRVVSPASANFVVSAGVHVTDFSDSIRDGEEASSERAEEHFSFPETFGETLDSAEDVACVAGFPGFSGSSRPPHPLPPPASGFTAFSGGADLTSGVWSCNTLTRPAAQTPYHGYAYDRASQAEVLTGSRIVPRRPPPGVKVAGGENDAGPGVGNGGFQFQGEDPREISREHSTRHGARGRERRSIAHGRYAMVSDVKGERGSSDSLEALPRDVDSKDGVSGTEGSGDFSSGSNGSSSGLSEDITVGYIVAPESKPGFGFAEGPGKATREDGGAGPRVPSFGWAADASLDVTRTNIYRHDATRGSSFLAPGTALVSSTDPPLPTPAAAGLDLGFISISQSSDPRPRIRSPAVKALGRGRRERLRWLMGRSIGRDEKAAKGAPRRTGASADRGEADGGARRRQAQPQPSGSSWEDVGDFCSRPGEEIEKRKKRRERTGRKQ